MKKNFEVNQKVKLTDKILKRNEGKAETIELQAEPGEVVKVDQEYLYIKTKHGTHYVHQDKVAAV